MKRFLAAVTLVTVFAATAFAGVQDFGAFTADIPLGWTAEADGTTVGIVKNDNSASMSVTVDENDGTSLKDLADAFVNELKGENLEQDKDGNYVFQFKNANGVVSNAVLNADEKHFALIVLTGMENASDEMLAILDSLNFKDL